ncbi:unnamed protein product, partial [Orchesella dallaii]
TTIDAAKEERQSGRHRFFCRLQIFNIGLGLGLALASSMAANHKNGYVEDDEMKQVSVSPSINYSLLE